MMLLLVLKNQSGKSLSKLHIVSERIALGLGGPIERMAEIFPKLVKDVNPQKS